MRFFNGFFGSSTFFPSSSRLFFHKHLLCTLNVDVFLKNEKENEEIGKKTWCDHV